MNSLYHKVAVASVCTALSFTLAPNQEAKAAIFYLPAIEFRVEGKSYSDVGEKVINSGEPTFGDPTGSFFIGKIWNFNGSTGPIERRAFYEYNLDNLSLAPNTIIKSAYLNLAVEHYTLTKIYKYLFVEILGYVGNGKPDLSDFGAGVVLDKADISKPSSGQFYTIDFDVTQFVNARVSNHDTFAGFGIRIEDFFPNYGTANVHTSLTIQTADAAEPVPEPTTIFGSALALGVGGWLKRKKSSQE